MSNAFLASSDWADVLREGFGAEPVRTRAGWTWTVFRRWGLRIAYPRFPAGLNGERCYAVDYEAVSRHADLLRMDIAPGDAAGCSGRLVTVTPRSRIHELETWSEERLSRSTRAKVRKYTGLVLRPAEAGDASRLFALYAATIARRRGVARYNARYFEALCRAAESNPSLFVRVAESRGQIAGFIAVAIDDRVAYYHHGGYDANYSPARPGFHLMALAIKHARGVGCRVFDMLTSPVGQQSLVEFKESFGAQSFEQRNFDVPTNLSGHAVILAMSLLKTLGR